MGKSLINGADDEANWSSVVNYHCMQMSLVLSVRFTFGDDWTDVQPSKLRPF